MTCQHCAELEERVAYLESELGAQRDAQRFANLRAAFRGQVYGVGSNQAAEMVSALYAAKGRPISPWALLDAIPSPTGRTDRDSNNVTVWACRVRKVLGPDVIETIRGRGYRLTETGMAKVAEIIGEARR